MRCSLLLVIALVAPASLFAQDKPDALELYRAGSYLDAIRVCQGTIAEMPKDLDSWVVLGWSQLALKRYKEALDSATKAEDFSAHEPRLVQIVGEAQYYLGRITDSLTTLEEYVRLLPAGDRIARVYWLMGECYVSLRQYQNADIAISTALYHEQGNAAWWTRLGYARELLDFLGANRQSISPLLILPHDYPDPDAIAAAFALHFLVKEYGIESRIVYGGVIGRTENQAMVTLLRIPVHPLKPADLKKYRRVALVDTQPAFENNPFPSNRRATMVIDQHESTGPPAADLALVDTRCGATCVIIAQALLLQKVAIPPRVATALAYGILSDTLNLYRAERPDVTQVYLSILHRADMHALAHIQHPMRPKPFFVTLARCIRKAMICGPLIFVHLGRIGNPDLVPQMADFLLTYQQSRWSLCTGRYRGRLQVSLRSNKPGGQVGEILRDAFIAREQAGGHGAIAGGSVRVGAHAPEEAWLHHEQELQERLMKRLRLSGKDGACKRFLNG